MKPADHSRELEQVMAYVDGALDANAAEKVRLHLAGCLECRQAEKELRGVSAQLQSWGVGSAPDSFRLPAQRSTRVVSTPFLTSMFSSRGRMAAAAVFVVTVIGVSVVLRDSEKRGVPISAAAENPQKYDLAKERGTAFEPGRSAVAPALVESVPVQGPPSQGPLIVRTARFTIVASNFDAARGEIERTVQQMGGFIGQMEAQGAPGSPRRVTATLRIPVARLDEMIAALRRLGQVVGEAQDGEDVTQQSADLNTRLENARVSEKRLRDILAQRTGKLSDVLDVEREIARVRGEIELMEAERRSLDRRVTYATVSVTLTEDRKSEVNLGPVPVSRRLRNALVDGWTNAIASGVDVLLFVAGVGPTVVLWALILGPAAVVVRRRLSRAS